MGQSMCIPLRQVGMRIYMFSCLDVHVCLYSPESHGVLIYEYIDMYDIDEFICVFLSGRLEHIYIHSYVYIVCYRWVYMCVLPSERLKNVYIYSKLRSMISHVY
jgi:hypothetical protein